MKNLNLIKRLLSYSHEKQTPQRFARYAAMLIMLLTLGVGQMWAATATTVYYAVNTSYTVKCNVNRKGDGDDWKTYTMTKTAHKYNDKYIYSCSFTDLYDGLGKLQFQLYDGSTWQSQVEPISSWTGASEYNGKLYVSSWIDYRYDHTISNGATIVWDNAGNTSWSNTYLYKEVNGGSGSNSSAFTRCGSTTQWYKTYASAETKIGKLQFRANTSSWNDGTHTTDLISAGDLSGVTLFTYMNTKDGYALNWQVTTNAKKATSGTKIYFDNTDAWSGEIWLKYGTSTYNRSSAARATQVTGTANLYVITIPNDCYFEKYYLASDYGWTGYNPINDTHVSKRIDYQASNLTSDITYVATGSTSGSSPTVYATTSFSGHTRRLTFGSHTNGQITVRYTDENGDEQTVSSASASYVDVAQTCNVVITAVPNTGYAPSGLTLGGGAITSGATQTIRADGTIVATFVAEETHNVTVSYMYGTRELHVDATFEVGITTASDISSETIDGFDFSAWSDLTGVTNNTGDLVHDPININTIASGSDGSMVCNYTPWTCSLDIVPSEGATGHSSRMDMSYDATEKAYYINRTTTSATERYRFFINSIEYSTNGNTELTIDETKVNANTNVTNYADNKPSVYFNDGPSGSNITIWFDYENKKAWVTEQKHTVTISSGGNGTVSPTSVSVGNVVASSTITATASDHYHWASWSVPDGVTIVSGSGTKDITIKATADSKIVTASFAGDVYTITYLDKGGSAFSGTQTSAPTTHTYGASTTLMIPTKTGYDFDGWFTASDCASGAVGTSSAASLGATAFTANITLYAKWTANTYTVSFDVNGGTASTPDSKEVTYGAAYGTLPGGMTHASKTFVGWYDDPDEGEGNHITAETIVSTASDHTLYAHYENVYSVNVNFKCGSDVIYPATSVDASPTSLAPTITAPEIFGYSFENWTGTNVTFADASSATTTITATAATSVTANYSVVPTVYFKNNLGWENVYVTFDAYFDGSHDNAPGNYDKPYFQMTQIGSSDVYYCVIPSRYTTSDYASWAWNIAFDNTGFSASDNVGTKTGAFDSGEFTGRGDFDPKATMFIPYNGDTETRNSGTFYKSGCWMKYNSTESGYQVKMNEYVTGAHAELSTTNLTAPAAGGYEFSATVYLGTANYSYGFKLYKEYQKNTNDLWYTNTGDITSATDNLPWAFWSGSEITADTRRCGLHTEALGDYKITVSFATGKPMVSVEYPVSTGDWKLIYKDLATWSGDAHTASWNHPSRVIKAKADAEDIVSFYVAHGSSPSIELYKCTAIDAGTGAETWTKQSDVSLTGISKKGVYNFKVSQNGSKVASVTVDGGYEGNFYIRTDASDGGWSNYKTSGTNAMTYSEYAEENSGFTHYFMRYVTSGSNIKFVIANDYNECISDTLEGDTYTGQWIEANGNVRFMWDHRTNTVSRAYISGSAVVSDRFLVLEGDAKMFDESGNALSISGLNANEINFSDDQNWIYEATVKAQPTARVKLTAKYNNKVQYFYGSEGARSDETTELLLGGSGTDKYKMRIVYDFKTNRLLRAFIPEGKISTALAINADLMIIREHQGDAQQIQFSGSGALSSVKTVYGAMKFNKYTVNGKEKTGGHAGTGASRYERDLFYISFPFDVKLSDAFGFGTYGKHWIIEYYDGKGRAKNGFWADSEPNWKFVWPAQRSSFTMKAFEGYILALDLDEMTESSSVWNNNVEDVYIYFPSDGDVGGISATSRTVDIDQDGYQCTIGPRFAGGDDRRQKDSYWHCIGVPSFANYSSDLTPTSEDATTIDWRTGSLPYLYEWNSSNNTVSVTSSATFSFKATYSYLVQYSGDHIYWSSVNTPSSIVARERTAPKNAEFRIELQKAGEKADQTFVRLTQDENVTAGYDFNYDLSKEFNKNQANIYTMVTTLMDDGPSITEVAGNVQPMSEQTTVIPMGVKIAADGDYTFAIPDGTEGIGVTLIDNETGIRTSLSALDYTINLSAGTYENRFVLEISPIKQMPTDIESVSDQHSAVRKVMIDGILYIVKDGKVFDAHGNRVK